MRLRDDMPHLNGATHWLNSRMIARENLIGKNATLFHFWSVSCDLCKTAFPYINQLRDDYNGKLNVVAVHMPRSNEDFDLDRVKNVARTYDISQPIYVDNNHVLTDEFSVRYVPAYYIFDANGKLRHFQAGESSIRLLLKRIERLID